MGRGVKILVTGGAGYIGSHTVVELYENGYIPVVIDNFSKSNHTLLTEINKAFDPPPRLYEGDCTDCTFLTQVLKKEKNIAGVIHFAAYKSVSESMLKPLDYYRNNITSLLAVIAVMQNFGIKHIVFSSSASVYGEPDNSPINEDAPFQKATCPYGETKQWGEQILRSVTLADPTFHAVSLRYFNPVGAHPEALIGEIPYDEPNNLVPCLMNTIAGLRDKFIVYGEDYNTPDGTCVRDYIHVVDVAKAHVKTIQHMTEHAEHAYRAYNVGMGCGTSVLQLVRQCIEVTGTQLPYEMGPRRFGDVMQIYANADRIHRELGWHTTYSVKEALQHAWNWEKKIRKIL